MEPKTNSFGMTKAQMDKTFPDKDRFDKSKHECWFVPCKSKVASNRCRICGDKRK